MRSHSMFSMSGAADRSIRSSIRLLAAVSSIAFCAIASHANAQVAPTEVNEEAVDEFGLERKTGRFSWSTGEIIGIGGEGSRIGISATGIRTPPHLQTVIPSSDAPVLEVNRPKLSISSISSEIPVFPGAEDPNQTSVTVEYFGGSHTFECLTGLGPCTSHYLGPHSLSKTTNGYLFVDKDGVEIDFANATAVIDFPSGKQETYSSFGFRKNNQGFMIRKNGVSGEYLAINQAIDFCAEPAQVSTDNCGGLAEARSATLPSQYDPILSIVDSNGGVTKLSWESKVAKSYRPSSGPTPPTGTVPFNYNISVRYPTGITLPGSSVEDITISYRSHNPSEEVHDDIRVSSITKNGITIDYDLSEYWPFGKVREAPPTQAEGGGLGVFGTSGTASLLSRNQTEPTAETLCRNILPPIYSINGDQTQNEVIVCWQTGGSGFVDSSGGGSIDIGNGPEIAPLPSDLQDVELSDAGVGVVYDLKIVGKIDDEVVSESLSMRPHFNLKMSRRQLEFVKDGLGRKTQYFYNIFNEAAGIVSPEGNGVVNQYGPRGNIIGSIIFPKTDSGESTLETLLTYPTDCTNTPLARCNKPLSATDPMGNITEYSYNDRGQVLTEVGPAPSPGAARPTVVNEYTMRTAYIKNASGDPVAAGPAISMLTKSFTCISSMTCDASTPDTDKVVTEYDYGPITGLNNLLLRGMAVTAATEPGVTETLRTCYQYNYFGERIAETKPRADLASCP